MSLFGEIPNQDALKGYAMSAIGLAFTIYGAWKFHYGKWKTAQNMAAADKPEAPMPAPGASPPPSPALPPKQSIPTLSPALVARLMSLETARDVEAKERLTVEARIQREREIWTLEEQIRRLKKELTERNEEVENFAKEIRKLRGENRILVEDTERMEIKIMRLRQRLFDSDRPKKGDSDNRN